MRSFLVALFFVLVSTSPAFAGLPAGDFNFDDKIDAVDIDLLSAVVRSGQYSILYDLNFDLVVDDRDREIWVHDIVGTFFGDANLDGEFNTSDLILTFQIGEYEDDVPLNSGWASGDWNGDGDFNTSDFILAFQDGGFEAGPRK
ncbi:MAG: hypothetical protein KDD60_04995 [Bdellovibrionales bacterium]|nr:hypothetical protein [Bdellovibrionales bacterium]